MPELQGPLVTKLGACRQRVHLEHPALVEFGAKLKGAALYC